MALFSLLCFFTLLLLCGSSTAESTVDQSDGLRHLQARVLQVIGSNPHALSFSRFAHRYGKQYETEEEMKLRFKIFSENLEVIRSTNSKGLPYTLDVNQFADLTWEEFQRYKLGGPQNCSATHKDNYQLTDSTSRLPTKKDWRQEGIVSPVKDQQYCGSCWAFSATGALEAAYAQEYGKNISLSEQQLVDCAGAFNNSGCKGGLPSQAFEYIKYNGGLETDKTYPYTSEDGVCKFSAKKVAIRVVDSINITLGAEDELKRTVAFIRPVSVAFEVVRGFHMYKKGVYTSNKCGSNPMDMNHAVLAVGYGVEKGVPYWLIKNSWGNKWGDKGYFKMELGKNMCGIATCASYPIVA